MRTQPYALFLLCAIICGISFPSCKKEQEKVSVENTALTTEVLAKIKALGFSTAKALKTEGGYIVEGDIFLSDENLDQVTTSPTLRIAESEQYRTTNLVTGTPRTITIALTNLPTVYTTAADEAIARYNALDLTLTFQRVSSGANITITGFYQGPNPDGSIVLGAAGFPSGGNPYNAITMNTHPAAYGSNPDVQFLASVMQHEIGHCIGFRHTDYFNRHYSCPWEPVNSNEGDAGIGAIHIPGTPSSEDANSWMLACSNGGNRTFNANDIVALNYLYGSPQLLPIASAPAATSRDNTASINVFARGTNNTLWHKAWTDAAGWSAWQDLGGSSFTDAPAAASRESTSLNVFARGANNTLLHRAWTSTTGWSAWQDLGGTIASAPAAISRETVSINVFARGVNNTLLHKYWTNAGGWSAWQDLGGTITSAPAAASKDANSIDVFAKGANNNLVHLSWTGTGGWSSWEDLGGTITSAPAAASRETSSINVFAKGANNNLVHKYWTTTGGWSSWEDLGGTITSAPAAASRETSSINVFAKGANNNLVHKYWTTTGGWSAWQDL